MSEHTKEQIEAEMKRQLDLIMITARAVAFESYASPARVRLREREKLYKKLLAEYHRIRNLEEK